MVRRQDQSKLIVAIVVKIAVAFFVYYEVPYAIGEEDEVSLNDLHKCNHAYACVQIVL